MDRIIASTTWSIPSFWLAGAQAFDAHGVISISVSHATTKPSLTGFNQQRIPSPFLFFF
jgi:hypothetical protein